MRPYLAIIKDSFRAAMASRVLYVLLFLIALLLLVLAPLHMRETLDWKLIMHENTRPDQVARRLTERHDKPDQKPIARIWELLSPEMKKRLQGLENESEGGKVGAGETSDQSDDSDEDSSGKPVVEVRSSTRRNSPVEETFAYQELIEELNDIIQDRDFYRAEDWEDRVLSEEAEGFIEAGVSKLSDERYKRLNRILIAQAVAPAINQGNTALEFWYAIWKMDFLTTSSTHQQFAQNLTSQLPFYFDKFVLSIGLFIAILVTANMIPETFEPGSLNLLLSKPISRWGLYIAKFIGGCVFILLCAAFLFLGIWLWLGLAMDVWDRAILFSIPLYCLVFAIYFSVSALVGLIWRSSIVSVILTLLFWALCFSAGSIHGFFSTKMGNSELVELTEVNGDVIAVDSLLQLRKWNNGEWDTALEADMNDEAKMQFAVNSYMVPLRNMPPGPGIPGTLDRVSPAVDKRNSMVYSTTYASGLLAANKKFYVAKLDDLRFEQIGEFPRETLKMMPTPNGVIVATGDGEFHRVNQEKLNDQLEKSGDGEKQDGEEQDDEKEQSKKPKRVNLFDSAGPNNTVGIRSRDQVAANPTNGKIAVYNRGEISMFEVDDEGSYSKKATLEIDVDFDKSMSCLMEYKGNTIVLVYGNGKVITIDAEKLEELNEYQPESRSAVDSISGSSSGRYFAIRYRNGNLWLLDMESSGEMSKADVIGQGDICAFGFGENDRLWVSDNTDRATVYELESGKQGIRHSPSGTWVEKSFRYAIAPIYKAFPKPGEFYKVVTYLSSSGDTSDNESVDLRRYPFESDNPWQPLRSGLYFMVLMIFAACVIFHFKDF